MLDTGGEWDFAVMTKIIDAMAKVSRLTRTNQEKMFINT